MNVWQLAAFRFLAGAGIGGEWTLGGVLVAEEWPEARRRQGAAWMHTGYYFGIFLAALVNWGIGSRYGWRAVFAVGGAPALLVAFIRYGVAEPKRWHAIGRTWTARRSFLRPSSARIPAAHHGECGASFRLHGGAVGRFGVRTVIRASDLRLREGYTAVSAGAPGLLWHHVAFGGYDSRLPRCCPAWRSDWDAGARSPFTSRSCSSASRSASATCSTCQPRVVPGLPLPAGNRRREFRRLYAVAPGTVPHRMPRQRVRLRHIVRAIHSRGHHFPGWRRSSENAHYRNTRGAHLDRVSGRPAGASMGARDPRQGASRLNLIAAVRPVISGPAATSRARVRRPDVTRSAKSTAAATGWRNAWCGRGLKAGRPAVRSSRQLRRDDRPLPGVREARA